MRSRRGRASLAVALLSIAVVPLADLVGYGSEKGFHVGLAVAIVAGLAGLAVALFAWNVATFKK